MCKYEYVDTEGVRNAGAKLVSNTNTIFFETSKIVKVCQEFHRLQGVYGVLRFFCEPSSIFLWCEMKCSFDVPISLHIYQKSM